MRWLFNNTFFRVVSVSVGSMCQMFEINIIASISTDLLSWETQGDENLEMIWSCPRLAWQKTMLLMQLADKNTLKEEGNTK